MLRFSAPPGVDRRSSRTQASLPIAVGRSLYLERCPAVFPLHSARGDCLTRWEADLGSKLPCAIEPGLIDVAPRTF